MQKRLLGRAHGIVSMWELFPLGDDAPYFWASNQKLVIFRPALLIDDMRTAVKSTREKILGEGFTLVQVDASTRFQTPLIAFNAQNSQWLRGWSVTRPVGVYRPPPCTFSPDGKWLLWLYDNGAGLLPFFPSSLQGMTWMAARLDGSIRLQCPLVQSKRRNLLWLPDSRHWLELAPEAYPQGSAYRVVNWPDGHRTLERAETVEPKGSGEYTRVLIHSLKRQGSQEMPLEREVKLPGPMDGLALGFTPHGAVLVCSGPYHHSITQVKMQEVELKGPVARVRPYGIRLPVACEVYEVVLDRHGKRLAWVLVEPQKEVGVWVSDLSGKGMRELGALEIEYDKDLGPTSEIPPYCALAS